MAEAPISMVTDNSVILAEHTNRLARCLNALIAGTGVEPITGDIYWQSGQSAANVGILAHANTLPRTYTFPDKTGVIALSDNSGGLLVTTKGDLLTYDGDANEQVRLPVGSNGQVLVADNTTDTGLAWKTSSGAAVSQLWQFTHAGSNQVIGAAWTTVSACSKANVVFSGSPVLFLVTTTLTPTIGFPAQPGFLRLKISGTPTYVPTSSGIQIVSPYDAGAIDTLSFSLMLTGLVAGTYDVEMEMQITTNSAEISTGSFHSCYMLET